MILLYPSRLWKIFNVNVANYHFNTYKQSSANRGGKLKTEVVSVEIGVKGDIESNRTSMFISQPNIAYNVTHLTIEKDQPSSEIQSEPSYDDYDYVINFK